MALFLFSFLSSLLIFLFIVFSIAFVTLYERHLLSLTQNRVGPMKVTFSGVFQPLLDGLKLLMKEQLLPFHASSLFFFFVPGLSFLILFLEWFCLPYYFFFLNFQFSFIYLLCLVGFSVYSTLLSSVMSKSKYSSLGGIRASSQSISFEIVFSLYLLCFLFLLCSYELGYIFNLGFFFLFYPYTMMVLAELGRAPFDFSEGESELVSGYNTEFSSVTFVLLFLGEYGVLLFFSVLGSLFFFDMNFFFVFFFFSLLLLIRSVYPRYRYDKLMSFFWKKLLPLSLFFFYYYYLFYY
uniref:NADH-ubiquinone oxidoreductase chain 1 n=1 Tax=Aphelenchoides besseyi TaxID=269767 RepID=A0A088CQE9_9BILA|nr:NADH dehydrogenase subunit 1 [Aphelenchoides besseyi]AII79380.1 NADH dehydrogenase subunit 1 [Aphelenchoides besseyi]